MDGNVGAILLIGFGTTGSAGLVLTLGYGSGEGLVSDRIQGTVTLLPAVRGVVTLRAAVKGTVVLKG